MNLTQNQIDALFQIRYLLFDKSVEYSGCLFEDNSFSCNEGELDRAVVHNDSDFIWHSHTDGKLFLSISDWLCFFYSKAEYTALFCKQKILIIRKQGIHKKIYQEMQKDAELFKGNPSIIFFKFIKRLEDYFKVDLSTVREETLPEIFKVDYKIIN